MQGRVSVVISFLSGLVGGIVVVVLVFSSPGFARFLLGSQVPQLLSSPSFSSSAPTDTPPTPDTHDERIVAAVERAQPAVVSIVITADVPIIEQYYEDVPSPFDDFFGNGNGFFNNPFSFQVPQFRQRGTEQREIGGGSGFIVSSDGLIITNRHVVSEKDATYTVFTNDGTTYTAEVVAQDPVYDLAVLKVSAQNLPTLPLADSDALRVGQSVIAIGTALGEFRNTVSVGVVSGLARSITAGDGTGASELLEEVVQTDAAINPGNSGGPLLNTDGEVVGVNVAVVLGSENIGFALPANLVRSVLDSVQATGTIQRPYLGVRYVAVTPALQEKNSLAVDYGILVLRGENADELAVLPGSPADKAGIEEGDIVLEADGVRLDESHSLATLIRSKKAGDSVSLVILHEGEQLIVTVTLENLPQ